MGRVQGLSTNQQRRIGLIAAWGRYPLVVADKLQRQGYEVYGAGIEGHAEPQVARYCRRYVEVGLARLGAQIRFFQQHGVRRAIMAGKIHKVLLFERNFLRRHCPDWKSVRTYYPHFIAGTKDRKDDSLLLAVVDTYAREGITIVAATDLIPGLLIKPEQLTRSRLSRAQSKDIEFGWSVAKEMGRMDIGQSVVVKGQAIIAVEAVEGTDECIRRAGKLCTSGGFTVVKVAKPRQDMRFDVPTIGQGTIQAMAAAGGRVLAVEAHKTILLDRQDVCHLARVHGIKFLGISDANVASASRAA